MRILMVSALVAAGLAGSASAALADSSQTPDFWAIQRGEPYDGAWQAKAVQKAEDAMPLQRVVKHRTFLSSGRAHHRYVRPTEDQ